MDKRVLVISYMALMDTTANGRTMKSLLSAVPSSQISLFTASGMPDSNSCRSAYKVTNRDAMKSLLRKEYGQEIDMTAMVPNQPRSVLNGITGRKKAWKYLMRELSWKLGAWNGKRLKKWLREQKVDYILYMYGDSASLMNFSVSASKYLQVPLLVYSCENYYFKKYNYVAGGEHSLFFKIYHRMSRRATKKLFGAASGLICNSQALLKLYTDEFHVSNTATIMMASEIERIENITVKPVEETKIVYLGSLGRNRVKALVTIAQKIHAVDPRLVLSVYGWTEDQYVQEKLNTSEGLKYMGAVPYEEVQNVIHEASLNLEVINNDEANADHKKYGLSTKFADSLASGTPFLIYAPAEMVETQFAIENECAFAVTKDDDIENVMRTALFDETMRRRQVKNAEKVTELFFNQERNDEQYRNLVQKAFEK